MNPISFCTISRFENENARHRSFIVGRYKKNSCPECKSFTPAAHSNNDLTPQCNRSDHHFNYFHLWLGHLLPCINRQSLFPNVTLLTVIPDLSISGQKLLSSPLGKQRERVDIRPASPPFSSFKWKMIAMEKLSLYTGVSFCVSKTQLRCSALGFYMRREQLPIVYGYSEIPLFLSLWKLWCQTHKTQDRNDVWRCSKI